jgi:DtxR family Mn-dependent transcriptional regulator
VGILNYPWDKSDVEAETLQASLSDELTSFLVKKLGNPQTCPHGNPMPGSAIEKAYLEAPSLEDAGVGTKIKIIRITEEGEMTDGMLSFCQEERYRTGRKVTVVDQQPGKGTLCEIEGRELHIPSVFSANLRWEAA